MSGGTLPERRSSTLAERLAAVEARIRAAAERAGRDPASIELVAVSKLQPPAQIAEAYEAGARVFGENYIQELEEKRQALHGRCPDARWHFIGRVQRNKARLIARADLVHGAGSAAHLDALAKAGPTRALLQVNVGGEASKGGLSPAELFDPAGGAALFAARPGCELLGLMTIPPPEAGRAGFFELAAIRDQLQDRYGVPLPHLSMGMSDDFEDAIAAGATLVRVGTAIFGPRPSG